MNTPKSTSRLIGSLFILVMVTWTIGYILIDSVISAPYFLDNVYPQKTKVIFGVLIEVLEATGVIGIAVLFFPILKKYNENIARGYFGLRAVESVLLVMIALSPLLLITLSREYINTDEPDALYFQTFSALIMSVREGWPHFILSVFYSFAAIMLNYVFYQTKLVPRIIAVWGLLSAILVLISAPMEAMEINWIAYAGISMGGYELFLGIWLILKGFHPNSMASVNTVNAE